MLKHSLRRLGFILILSCLQLSFGQAMAADVVLTVTAKDGRTQNLTLDDFQQMTSLEFQTETIWTNGPQRFQGVPLKQILSAADIHTGTVSALAINDYKVDIPLADLSETTPIVAFLHNGAPMSVRDKGPLWVVYPYDSDKKFQTETVYSRSIWQLNRLNAQ